MGKKFITLSNNATRYRLYSDDIRTVFQKPIRKLPPPPHFPLYAHAAQQEGGVLAETARSITTASNSS
jgi:hypothetical protein